MKRLIITSFIMLFILTGCTTTDNIVVTGSTSVEPFFTESVIPQEMTDLGYPIQYQSVGSSAGVQAVEASTTDFGTSSRALTEDELATGLTTDIIAYDGIAINY